MENKIEKILFNTILEGSELFRAVDDINDLFKSEMRDLLQYIKQNYTIGMGDGNYYNYDLDEVTIDDIINNWSNEREHK